MDLRQAIPVVVTLGVVLGAAGFGLLGAPDGGPDEPTVATTTTPAASTVEPAPSTTTDGTPTTPDASLSVSADDPPAQRSHGDGVDEVAGAVDGTLDWTAGADVEEVTLVVQSWTPASGWQELRRVTVASGTARVDLGTVLGRQVYAGPDRADEFAVTEDGATVARTGYVAVTALLVDADGTERGRVRAVDDYTLVVTNVESTGSTSGGGGSSETTRASLVLDGPGSNPTSVGAGNVAPGDAGQSQIAVTNDGDAAGTVGVTVETLSASENGLTDPERDVDDTPSEPELPAHLDVRVSLLDDGDVVTYLAGNATSFVPFSSLSAGNLTADVSLGPDETAHVVVEWQLDADVGNVVQSDGVTLDFALELTGDGSRATRSRPGAAAKATARPAGGVRARTNPGGESRVV